MLSIPYAARKLRAAASALLLIVLAAGCSVRLPTSNDNAETDNGNANDNVNDNGDGTRGPAAANIANPQDVPGFFAADEQWTLAGADTAETVGVLVVGVGDLVEFAVNFPNSGCFAIRPQSSISFDGATFSFSTDYSTRLTGSDCRFSVTAPAAQCGPDSPRDGESCELPNGQYTIVDQGTNRPAMTAGFAFPQACDALPPILDSFGDWSLTSMHPVALPFAAAAGDLGEVFVAIAGNGGRLLNGGLCVDADASGCPGCLDVPVIGTVRLNGTSLEVSVTFSDSEDACGILFNGELTSCAVLAEPGVDGMPIARFTGTGMYSLNDETGPIEVLYLTGDPDGSIRR
ncbi:MAG: hypothetical protein J5J06_16685 [Phycisphaerae bacterium]|nr:hypothetical protein [Phycisphaerae bacterium]